MKALRNEAYLEEVRKMPCIACLLKKQANAFAPSHPHHESVSFKFRNYKRMFDYGAIPLCWDHHRLRHDVGFGPFWRWAGVNERFPSYLVIHQLESYSRNKNLLISDNLKNVLSSKSYYQFEEAELAKFIDKLAENVHGFLEENVNGLDKKHV